MEYLMLLAGFVLLFLGGESLIRGSVSVAKRAGLSPLFVGLVIVGFGTSSPELSVSVQAALKSQPGIAIGNVIGSNIANLLLILGTAILICPLVLNPKKIGKDVTVMLASTIIFIAFALLGEIERWHGIVMVLFLLIYIVASYFFEKSESDGKDIHEHEAEEFSDIPLSLWLSFVAVLGGLVTLVLGSSWFVEGAVQIATNFGIPEAVIGLSLVAVGTSLPELATAIIASIRKHPDVVLGNIIGSNIFNAWGVAGVTSIVTNITVEERIIQQDVWVLIMVSMLLAIILMLVPKLGRLVGASLIAAYAGYIALIY